mmetsp:Transcript_21088/g.37750  ORF Transcript_21088/g.37750 Transcript_21088/m.37750 type:complete len:1032 (-) Transcript_21088:1203-4298(-)
MFEEVLAAIEDSNSRRVLSWVNSVQNVDEQVDSAYGGTALHWAVHWGDQVIVKALLARNADPNLRNNFGATPLHWAAKAGSVKLVKLLMSYGADPAAKNNTADTPMDVAQEAGEMAVLEALNSTPYPPQPMEKPREPSKPSRGKAAAEPRRAPAAKQTSVVTPSAVAKKSVRTAKGKTETPADSPRHPHASNINGQGDKPTCEQKPAADMVSSPLRGNSMTSTHSPKRLGAANSGYSTPLVNEVANSTITALQRGKIRAEMELVQKEKIVEDLREQLGQISKELFLLQAKSKTFDDMKTKLEEAGRQKMRLQFEMKQTTVDAEGKRRKEEYTKFVEREQRMKEHHAALQAAEQAQKKAEKEKEALQKASTKEKEELMGALRKKEAQLDNTRSLLNAANAEKARFEVDLKAIENLRAEVIDLRKDKALLEVDLQGMQDIEAEGDRLRSELMESGLEVKKLLGQLGEIQASHGTLKTQFDLAKGQLAQRQDAMRKVDEQQKEISKLKVLLSSAEEAVKQASEFKAVCENGADTASIHLQNSLEIMQKEKQDMALKQAETESSLRELKTKFDELLKQKEIDDVKLTEMGDVMKQNAVLTGENSRLRHENQMKTLKVEELNSTTVEAMRNMGAMEAELKDLREAADSMHMVEKECLNLRVESKKYLLELEHVKAILDSLQSEKVGLEDANRENEEAKQVLMRLQVDHELLQERLQSVEAELEEYQNGNIDGQHQSGNEMVAQIENLGTKLATMESECGKLELENRKLIEQLAERDQTIMDMDGERLEWVATKEMLKKLESVEKEKNVLALDVRHLQETAQEMERQKRTVEEILKDRERQLHNREKELDKKSAQLEDTVTAKETLARELQGSNTDLKIAVKDLEARLRETERGRNEEYRMLQAERENMQRQMRGALKQSQQEAAALKQRLTLMQKERSGLEMQLKALQEASQYLGGTGHFENAAAFGSTPPRSARLDPLDDEFSGADSTPRRTSLPPVTKVHKGHMPRPPTNKKELHNIASSRLVDTYSGHLDEDF